MRLWQLMTISVKAHQLRANHAAGFFGQVSGNFTHRQYDGQARVTRFQFKRLDNRPNNSLVDNS